MADHISIRPVAEGRMDGTADEYPDLTFREVEVIVADMDSGPDGWYVDKIERTTSGWWVTLWNARSDATRLLLTWADWRAAAGDIGR